MEINVENRRENTLLEREEIRCSIVYDGATPTRKKIKEALKNNLGVSGYIVIHKIQPFFGMKKATVYAKIYPSEAIARKTEEAYRLTRGETKKSEEKEEPKPKEETKKSEGKEKPKPKEETKEEEGEPQ